MTQMTRRLVRRRVSGRSASSQRRKLQWADFATQSTLAAGATSRLNMLSNYETVKGSSSSGSTIMRILLRTVVWPSATFSATQQLAYGILHTSSTIATTLDVLASPYEDWMLDDIAWMPFIPPAGSASSLVVDRLQDIRAKRKLDELDSGLFLCLSNGGTTATAFAFHARILLALP
jgi:hypothetical protein